MSKHIRHIWAKANQYVKVHRQRPKKASISPFVHLSAAEMRMIILGMVALTLLGRLLGC